MKRFFLSNYNKLIAYILTLLGVGGACTMGGCEYGTPAVEYGTPSATFKIYGTVSSEDQNKIPSIQVVMRLPSENIYGWDTAYTDVNGKYAVEMNYFPGDQDFILEINDIDGANHGQYESKDTTISFTDPEFENGDDSWYQGETSKEMNIALKAGN